MIDKLAATYGTVGTDRARDLGIAMLGSEIASPIAHGLHASTIAVGQKLSNHRPAHQYFFNHIDSPCALKLPLGLGFRSSFEERRSVVMADADPHSRSLRGKRVIL